MCSHGQCALVRAQENPILSEVHQTSGVDMSRLSGAQQGIANIELRLVVCQGGWGGAGRGGEVRRSFVHTFDAMVLCCERES